MLDEKQKNALKIWYEQSWILDSVKRSFDAQDWEDVEAIVHRNGLYPLGKHAELPDYMRNDEGKPLFPTNLNPINDMEGWQDAIEIGWAVVAEKLGFTMDEVQQHIRDEQDADWEIFMKSVEERKKARGQSTDD
jgi:hypothetical protein